MTMKKTILLFFMFFAVLSISGQTVSNDTIRQDLTKDFLTEIGDTTDVIITNISGTGNWFISFGAGINSLHAEANRLFDTALERSRFAAQLSVGKWFTPQFGLRLQMGTGFLQAYYYPFRYYNLYDYMPDHTIMPEEVKPYITNDKGEPTFLRKFAFSDWSLSFMTDIVRWFTPDSRRIGLYLFVGPGYTYTYANQGLEANNSFAFKMSGQFNVRVHENWDVFAELHGTIVDESFDGKIGGYSGKINRTLEGYAGVSLGVSYRFGGKKFDRYVKVNPIVHESVMRTVTNVVEKKVTFDERIITTFAVRFYIDQHDINEDQVLNIERISRYMKRDPEYKVRLSGFADKETAYPEYNQRLSERRVNSVKKYLVEKCGIDPSRIVLNPQGDKVRVYEEDFRWNRVVVMTLFKENDEESKAQNVVKDSLEEKEKESE